MGRLITRWLLSAHLILASVGLPQGTWAASPSRSSADTVAEAGAVGDGLRLAQRFWRPRPPPPRPIIRPRPRVDFPLRLGPPRETPYLRVPSIATAEGAALLGAVTTDPRQARFYLTQHDGALVLHTNYAPPGLDSGGPFTLQFTGSTSAPNALENAIATAVRDGRPSQGGFAGRLQRTGSNEILGRARVYVDARLIGPDGRPPIDLSGARNIRIVDGGRLITARGVEVLNSGRWPRPLIETIAGCCLKGRPPGQRAAILSRLATHRFNRSNTTIVSMVADRGTAAELGNARNLQGLAFARKSPNVAWRTYLRAALARGRGRNLILLTHVVGNRVVVEGANGQALFEISIGALQRLATRYRTNLVLLGCETSAQMDNTALAVGVIGRYNTVDAVRALDRVLSRRRNGADFMESLASPGMYIVAQPGTWSRKAIGASLYSRVSIAASRIRRVMRIWFLGRR